MKKDKEPKSARSHLWVGLAAAMWVWLWGFGTSWLSDNSVELTLVAVVIAMGWFLTAQTAYWRGRMAGFDRGFDSCREIHDSIHNEMLDRYRARAAVLEEILSQVGEERDGPTVQ